MSLHPVTAAYLVLALLLTGCNGIAAKPAATATPTPVYAPQPSATFFIRFLDTGRFQPAQLRGQPGQLVKLVLVGGQRKHDFTSPSLNVNIDVPPQQVQIINVELPMKPGAYDFWSAQPGDRQGGMVGQFLVEPPASS